MLHICIKYDMHRGVCNSQPSAKFWRYVAEQLDIPYSANVGDGKHWQNDPEVYLDGKTLAN